MMLTVTKHRPRMRWVSPLRGGFAIVVVLALIVTVGCSHPASPAAASPPGVDVAHPVEKEVIEWDTYAGYLEAPESANVAARVSGLIVQMPFAEGSIVRKGDLLAVIDDRPFKADLDAKLADEQNAEAALGIANVNFNRLPSLRATGAVSQQDFDNAKANVDQALATVASKKA